MDMDTITTQRIADCIDRTCGLDALFVYGSGAKAAGAMREGSDLDLAVLARQVLVPEAELALRAELADLAGRDVDLVWLDRISPILGMQVIRHGRCIIDCAPSRTANVVATMFSRYADLKRVRQEAEERLIEDYKNG